MKRTAILASILCLAAFPAQADVSIGFNFGPSPAYIEEPEPAYPVYVNPPVYPEYYRHWHHHHRPDRWRRDRY